MKNMKKITICFIIVTLVITMQCFGIMAKGRDDNSGSEIGNVGVKEPGEEDSDPIIEPTTAAPSETTTEAPTTEAPTTEAPTTESPTTEKKTTEAPTTEAPTTEAPTTEAPTEAPTTEAPKNETTSDSVNETEAPTQATTEAATEATTAVKTGNVQQQTTEYKPESIKTTIKSVDERVERADSDNDNIRVYYYMQDKYDIVCKLDYKKLQPFGSEKLWNDAYSLNMYVLISTLNTTNQEDFITIKAELCALLDKIDRKDKIILYSTMSDGSVSKIGEYGSSDSDKMSSDLENVGCNEDSINIYESIKNLADEIPLNENLDPMRNVMVVISDGISDGEPGNEDNKGVLKTLRNDCVSLYYVQVKNPDDSSLSSEEINKKIDTMAELAMESGGETFDSDVSKRMEIVYEKLTSCYIMTYIIDKDECLYGENHSLILAFDRGSGEEKLGEVFVRVKTLDVQMEESVSEDNSGTATDSSKDEKKTEIASKGDGDKTENNSDDDKKDDVSRRNIIICIIALIALVSAGVIIVVVISRSKKKKALLDRNRSEESKNQGEYQEGIQQGYQPGLQQGISEDPESVTQKIEQPTGIPVQQHQTVYMGNTSQRQYAVKPIVIEIWYRGSIVKQIKANISGSMIVGRANICDVVIDNQMVSRQHFALEFDGVDIYIQDLETRNGTFVNGSRITQKTKLNLGDKIKIGSLGLVIRW